MAIRKQFQVSMVKGAFHLNHTPSGKTVKVYTPTPSKHGKRFAAKRALALASADCRAANDALAY